MNKFLISLGLATILTIPFAGGSNVFAQNNMDPKDRGCDEDAETITSTSGGKFWYGAFQSIDIRIELRKSEKCTAKWVKANVPKDTQLYLKNQSDNKLVSYMTKVNGWHYSNMWNYDETLEACVMLPNNREVCTSPI